MAVRCSAALDIQLSVLLWGKAPADSVAGANWRQSMRRALGWLTATIISVRSPVHKLDLYLLPPWHGAPYHSTARSCAFFDPTLRTITGLGKPVQNAMMRDANTIVVLQGALAACQGGMTVAFGCFGGRHRLVAMAEPLAEKLGRFGKPVEIIHRELELTRITT